MEYEINDSEIFNCLNAADFNDFPAFTNSYGLTRDHQGVLHRDLNVFSF